MNIDFDNTYARLPGRFFGRATPTTVKDPESLYFNEDLARVMGLDVDDWKGQQGVAIMAGNLVPKMAEPLSMAYAGYQFGHFSPNLGDGRAILLGEVVGIDGVRRDIQLKGAGRTPKSRGGDGRAGIGPVLREVLVSEAMAALGVPTTRSLGAVLTGESIYRTGPIPSAVLTRVAQSHVRVGTFQYFLGIRDEEGICTLADYVIDRHFPQCRGTEHPYLTLLDNVIDAQVILITHWQMLGFIHGVMNTDNTSIVGETLDYGPCAFMDTYDPKTVFSSIDYRGRYAYGNQPAIGQWNLAGFAQTLVSSLRKNVPNVVCLMNEKLGDVSHKFAVAHLEGMRAKLGLANPLDDDAELVSDLLATMHAGEADFTQTFCSLSELSATHPAGDCSVRSTFKDPAAFDAWAIKWRERLSQETRSEVIRQESMRVVNPVYIPRNHLVEEVLLAAHNGDIEPFRTMMTVLKNPYQIQSGRERFAAPPRPDQVVEATYCGT